MYRVFLYIISVVSKHRIERQTMTMNATTYEMRLEARSKVIRDLENRKEILAKELAIQWKRNELLVNALKDLNVASHKALEIAGE